MIKELTRKTLFAPRRLINEMVRWILGVHSSEGTIRVANTATPGEERSLDLNVDVDAMKGCSDEWAASRGLSDPQREETANVMRQHLDGVTLVWQNDLASVNADWLDARLENLKSDEVDDDTDTTTPTDLGEYPANRVTQTAETLWDRSTATAGAAVRVAYKVEYSGSTRMIYAAKLVFDKSGRLSKIETATNEGWKV